MTTFLAVNEALPFLLSAVFSMVVWASMFFVRNQWPEEEIETNPTSSLGRFIQTWKIAWVALLPGFGYGFLEATLHGIFPIYGLRIGHEVGILSFVIPCFAAGSIISQLPLGIRSDRVGRRKILLFVLSFGTICFLITAALETSVVALFILFTLSGMFVGSLYSLGISYMTDLLPRSLLPAGNLMVAIAFSFGSISGPDRKSTRLNSSHVASSYAVFCLKQKSRRFINDAANSADRSDTWNSYGPDSVQVSREFERNRRRRELLSIV